VVIGLHAELGRGMAMNLMLGDCLERMKEIPDGSVDLILADPPYGTTACKWDTVIPLDKMWEQLKRIIKPNGAIVLFGGEPFSSLLRCSNIKDYKYDYVWKKNRPTGLFLAKKQPLRYHEFVHIFYKKQSTYNPIMTIGKPNNSRGSTKGVSQHYKCSTFNESKTDGLKYPSSVLEFQRPHPSAHPTQKPVALMEYLIKTYTNEGETVLDFVMGSGTTGVACKNTGRKFIGIEKDAGYFEIAKQRLGV